MSKAFGVQSPNQGEDAVSWQTWSDGNGGTPTITGDVDWGKLHLQLSGAEGRSAVYDLGSSVARTFTLTENRYGTGTEDATLQIRGNTSSFLQDDVSPAWEDYSTPIGRTWRYVQVRETTNPFDFPLGVSANGRYLVDGIGAPFLLIGDSPQGMISDLTPAQMATYMSNRQGYGINCLQIHLLSGATFGGNSTTFQNANGDHAFTSDGDISTPNEPFFASVDAMINLAATHGMVVFLSAVEHLNASVLLKTNGATKCTVFGEYLGDRYKDFTNIVWCYGNDYVVGQDATADACYLALADGLRSQDTNHLNTIWRFWNDVGKVNDDWETRIELDNVYYCDAVPYGAFQTEIAKTPAWPVFFIEGFYEDNAGSTPLRMRRYAWYSMLCGGCGFFYCAGAYTYKFAAGWADYLDSFPGLMHVSYIPDLLSNYEWYNLLLDTGHTILTSGYGTYSGSGDVDTNDFAPCAYLADGSLAIIYMTPTNRTMSVDMSFFSGTVTCRWFDVCDGSFAADAASPHANSGSHDFSRAGANAGSDNDWVLVLSV